MSEDDIDRAADALGAAIAARDVEAIRALYAEEVSVWHASTGATQTKAENSGLLEKVFQIASSLAYVNIRRHRIEGGLVQQHDLVGVFDDGKPMPALHVCMIIRARGGRILSIEEYFDGATYAEVWSRIAAL